MNEIRNTNLRFNLGESVHQKAWDYLHEMDKNELGSQNQVVIRAVVEFFDRYYALQDDPYLETRKREEEFTDRIIKAVESKIEERTNQRYFENYNDKIDSMLSAQGLSEGNCNEIEDNIDLDWGFIEGEN